MNRAEVDNGKFPTQSTLWNTQRNEPKLEHRNHVSKMARKCWMLICAHSSQIIRESEDGLSSELCQKKRCY